MNDKKEREQRAGEPTVDREQSVYELQKADVQRQLGEALDDIANYKRVHCVSTFIQYAEKKIVDALAVLDNMEGEDWPTIDKVALCPVCNPHPAESEAEHLRRTGQYMPAEEPKSALNRAFDEGVHFEVRKGGKWEPAEEPKDNSLPPCSDCAKDESSCEFERGTCTIPEDIQVLTQAGPEEDE